MPADYLTDLTDPADPKSVLKSLIVDGEDHTNDWSITDFTMAELKEWIGGTTYDAANERPKVFNGKLPIISFQDIIDIAKAKSKETGRSILVYPETKNPTWNNAQAIANGCGAAGSHPLEDALIKIIKDNGLNTKDAPILVQSFEPGSLKYMRSHGLETRQVQLVDGNGIDFKTGKVLLNNITNSRPFDWTVAGDARLYDAMLTPRALPRSRPMPTASARGRPISFRSRSRRGRTATPTARPTRDRRRRLRRRTRPAWSRTRTSSAFSSTSSRSATRRSILPPTIAATRAWNISNSSGSALMGSSPTSRIPALPPARRICASWAGKAGTANRTRVGFRIQNSASDFSALAAHVPFADAVS